MLGRIVNGTSFNGTYGYITSTLTGNFGGRLLAINLDRDGADELVIGAPNALSNSYPSPGYVAVMWGGPFTFPGSFDFISYLNGDAGVGGCQGFLIQGGNCDKELGFELGGGDVDGDSYPDLAMTTGYNCNNGPANLFVLRGGPRAQFKTMTLDEFSSNHGYKFTDIPNHSVSLKVAHLNNDGIADIILADTVNDRVDIIWGRLNGFPPVSSFLSLTSTQKSTIFGPGKELNKDGYYDETFFGSSFAIGNVYGDKKNELIIGAPFGNNGTGAVYVFSKFPAQQKASDSDFKIVCEATDTNHLGLGDGVGVGAITDSGMDDLIICGSAQATQLDASTFFGSYCVAIFGKPIFAPPANITKLAPADGFYMSKEDGCLGRDGRIVFLDVNDDGVTDAAIGDYCAESLLPAEKYNSPLSNNGSITFILGQKSTQTGFPVFLNVSQIAEKDGGVWKGTESKSLSYAMTVGNFNGDGKLGIAASTPFSRNFMPEEKVYVALSSATTLAPLVCDANSPTGSAPELDPSPNPNINPNPITHTSAGNRVTPLFYPEFILLRNLASVIHIPKPVKNAMIHGGVNSASKTINYALEVKGYSAVTGFLAQNVVYYGGMYALNYCNRYSELATNHNIPEAEKSTTAAYQALADIGTLVATKAVLAVGGTLCNWLGKAAESKGWTRVSSKLNWLSEAAGDFAYAYQNRNQGVVTGVASILGGHYIEKAATKLGKELVDNCLTPIQPDTYKKSNQSKLVLFPTPTPKSAALIVERPHTRVPKANRE